MLSKRQQRSERLHRERLEMLPYFLQAFKRGHLKVTGLNVTELMRLCK